MSGSLIECFRFTQKFNSYSVLSLSIQISETACLFIPPPRPPSGCWFSNEWDFSLFCPFKKHVCSKRNHIALRCRIRNMTFGSNKPLNQNTFKGRKRCNNKNKKKHSKLEGRKYSTNRRFCKSGRNFSGRENTVS